MENRFEVLSLGDSRDPSHFVPSSQIEPPAKNNSSAGGESRRSFHTDSEDVSKPLKQPMVWIDLEMTGLDIDKCTILSIACLITSGDLKRVMVGPELNIHQSDEVLADMNEWSEKTHKESGLTELCRNSMITMKDAEEEVLGFVQRHCIEGKAPLAGNSVHVDKMFLRKHMPKLDAYLHFRIIDVSTVNELARRWVPGKLNFLKPKAKKHRAMPDLFESLEELRIYQQHMFDFKGSRGQNILLNYTRDV